MMLSPRFEQRRSMLLGDGKRLVYVNPREVPRLDKKDATAADIYLRGSIVFDCMDMRWLMIVHINHESQSFFAMYSGHLPPFIE